MKRLAALALAVTLAAAAHAATGGPDALGYTWRDVADGCPADLPTLGATPLRFDDPVAAIGPLDLGFPFPWAGRTVTQAWVSPSGFVAFSDQGAAGASIVPQLVPDPTAPNDLIATFWRASPARFVQWDAQADRVVVEWAWDGATFGYDTGWLEILRNGDLRMSWGVGRFAPGDATVALEDAAGARGTTYVRDGSVVEPGFPRIMSGQAACFTAPSRLDCASPLVVGCGDRVTVNLPASAPAQAETYPCSPRVYPANERVLRLDVASPRRVTLSTTEPSVDLLRIAAPPPCSEATCLEMADASLVMPVAFAGAHWFVVDSTVPGLASPVVDVACATLPSLTCGTTLAGTTLGAPNAESRYDGIATPLDGGEWHASLVTTSAGHVEVVVEGATPMVVLRDPDGRVLASGRSGAALFGAPAGEYVVTVDDVAGDEADFTVRASCGTRLDCNPVVPIACGTTVRGDTSLAPPGNVGIYSCAHDLLDGRESRYRLNVPGDRVVDLRLVSSQPGQEVAVLSSCDEATCVAGVERGTCERLPPGDYVVVIDGPLGAEGPFDVQVQCLPTAPDVVDLRAVALDASALPTDCRDTSVSGPLRVSVANRGSREVRTPFDVVAFLDADGDRLVGATEAVLGRTRVTSPVPGEGTLAVDVACSGTLTFREAPITALVDERLETADVDRANDARSTGEDCTGAAPAEAMALRLEWQWTSSAVAPLSVESESIPLVADLTGDGSPEIVFVTQECCTGITEGVVRAVSGRDGSELWAADDPARRVRVATAVAVGDVDGDGSPEIAGQLATDTSRLILLNADGSLRWTSVPLPVQSPFDTYSGAPAIADLDGDGSAEVVWGPNALDGRTGQLFWTPQAGGTLGSDSGGPISTVADIDMDGDQEVVAGSTVYTWNAATRTGDFLWSWGPSPDGFAAVGDVLPEPGPDVVLTRPYRLMVLRGTDGAIMVDVPLPSGGGASCGGLAGTAGGPPTLADVDGDGRLDVLVVVADWLACYDGDGTLLWKAPFVECSSGTTSVTAFDLDGDGSVEVIGKDQEALRIFRGLDGVELASVPGTSGTAREMPVVADVDGDGQAEIVVVENRLLGGSGVGMYGLRVYGSAATPWQGARPTWNQHAYHVSNIADDLRLPLPSDVPCVAPSPLASEGFRVQHAIPRGAPLLPNVTLTLVSAQRTALDGCWQDVLIRVRVGNAGGAACGGSSVDFVDASGVLLNAGGSGSLDPGEWRDVERTVRVPASAPVVILVTADASGIVAECSEDDNDCLVTDADAGTTPEPLPLDVGAALRVRDAGDPNAPDVTATLDWTIDFGGPRTLGTGTGEQHYHVRRALMGFGAPSFAIIPGTEPLLAATYAESTPRATNAELPKAQGYLVVAADACEVESGE